MAERSREVGVIPAGGSGWLSTVSALLCFQLDCSTYELERLHTKVTSLCNRIEQIQCHNAKDRLAQSGMGALGGAQWVMWGGRMVGWCSAALCAKWDHCCPPEVHLRVSALQHCYQWHRQFADGAELSGAVTQ